MAENHFKKLPIYLQLAEELEQMIVVRHLKRHTRMPSESELAATHAASLGTIQKALGELVRRNVIYRRHGQGTFVAPRTRKMKIPIVTNQILLPGETQSDYYRFFSGALEESMEADLPFEPMVTNTADFMANLEDVSMIYPESAGVMFFRGFELWKKADWPLRRQNLPMMFFGPDIYGRTLPACHRVFYREREIAGMIVRKILSRGFRRIGFLEGDSEIFARRRKYFEEALSSKGLSSACFPEEILKEPEILRTLPRDLDVVYCPVAVQAVPLIQKLERQLNFRIPRDLAVISVDNIPAAAMLEPQLTTVDLCNYENGRLCMRKFAECLAGSSDELFEGSGQLRLVERETC